MHKLDTRNDKLRLYLDIYVLYLDIYVLYQNSER